MFPRQWFHFEAPEAGGGDPAAPAPAPEPAAQAEPAAPAEPAAQGQPWAPDPEEWQQAMSYLAYLGQRLEQPDPEPQQALAEPSAPELNPFDDGFGQQLAAFLDERIQGAIEQAVGPLQAWTYEQQLAEGENLARDVFHDIVAREGELPEQDKAFEIARALANVYLPEEAERRGYGPKAAEAALERSVKFLRDLFETVGKSYHERKMNELQTLAGAPSEPAASTTGASAITVGSHSSLMDVARKHAAAAIRG